MKLSDHLFITLMFSSVKSQPRYKRSGCVTQFQFFYVPVSILYSFSMRYRDATTRSASQMLACTQITRSVHYELALTNATHHTSNVSLLQASVKPCCDLPKQSTFPLFLLCLLYSKSSPHYDTFHTHKILLRCSNSQLPQNITQTERQHSANITWTTDYFYMDYDVLR